MTDPRYRLPFRSSQAKEGWLLQDPLSFPLLQQLHCFPCNTVERIHRLRGSLFNNRLRPCGSNNAAGDEPVRLVEKERYERTRHGAHKLADDGVTEEAA